MEISGTLINYYFHCKRHLWLFGNNIKMEHNSEAVAIGKIISENTYNRENHEIQIDNIVIDFFDTKTKTIHEVKKSDKMEDLHIWQAKYYLFILEEKGIYDCKAEIDYPKLRQTITLMLNDKDRTEIINTIQEINKILAEGTPPPVINKKFCKNCSYYDLCYI